ncbi:MAG TPA: hypothetical protein ENK06_13830, partial [Gammaproteobacteria bacterium]|nr:hypothetical protein [Gammaproteobacteria bacterium]
MSIILDALERVENNRNLEKKIEATLEPGLEEGTEVELTQDYHSPLSKKHSRRIGKSSINVVIGIIFLCVVAGLYFLLDDDAGNTETQTETPASDSEFVTETIDKSDDSANKAIAFEELENQFFNSSEEVDINRLPQDASPETKPELLNTTTVEKITPAITNIPEQKTSENQAILRSENTPANKKSEKPEIVAKEVEITSASDIETGSVDAVVSAPKEITETTNKPMSPANWIARGKTKFRKKGLAAAAVIWNKGFTSLSPTTPVISIMINHVSDLAIQTLNQLYQHDIDAFAVKGVFKHKPAYFTLALQPEGKTGALIANIEHLTDSKPFVTTQAYISKRMDGLLPVKTSRAAPIKENKPVKIKKLSNRERLKIAEEAVIKGEYKLAIKKLRPVLFNSQGDWEVLFWIG